MCLKHVEPWNELIVKQKFCASSWLITEMHGQQNVKKKTFTCSLGIMNVHCVVSSNQVYGKFILFVTVLN